MWRLIHKGKMPIEDVMETYTGVTDLQPFEKQLIMDYSEGGSGSDNGDHTDRLVEVYAYGPRADLFDSLADNTHSSVQGSERLLALRLGIIQRRTS
jgi:alkaline phosphatase